MSCFFFNDTATTEIYTLSLHDALPISRERLRLFILAGGPFDLYEPLLDELGLRDRVIVRQNTADRKSTRLNSSHQIISYAVFCLKKKKHIRTASQYLYN